MLITTIDRILSMQLAGSRYKTAGYWVCRDGAVVQWCMDGAVVRVLASHRCGPRSIPGPGVMWVEFVVGSRPCSKGFSLGFPVFLPPQKPTF